MRFLLLALLGLCSFSSFAQVSTLSCDQGSLMLEERCLSYRYVDCYAIQRSLKISNPEIVSYLVDKGAVTTNNEGDFTAFGGIERKGSDGSIIEVKTSAQGKNVLLRMTQENGGLKLDAYNYTEMVNGHSVWIELSEKIAQWKFVSCE